MNFKEALIAHPYAQVLRWIAEGEVVEGRVVGDDCTIDSWGDFPGSGTWADEQLLSAYMGDGEYKWEFRLAPRTIFVNGVEVPAPESVAPENDSNYYIACPSKRELFLEATMTEHELDAIWLKRGLVYLNKEDAIARAKAMLLTNDK